MFILNTSKNDLFKNIKIIYTNMKTRDIIMIVLSIILIPIWFFWLFIPLFTGNSSFPIELAIIGLIAFCVFMAGLVIHERKSKKDDLK